MPRLFAIIVCTYLAVPAAAGVELTGRWEIQSMGADRVIELTQKGKRLIAHRVMWPEFEGERYKLEHLYRGKIQGDAIRGQLLVKEDELPDFEVLRPFSGKIASKNQIILDGLPVKRIGRSAAAMPTTPTSPARPSPPPSLADKSPDTEIKRAGSAIPEAESDGASLLASIIGGAEEDLFLVSNRVTIPNPVADRTEEGDALFRQKRYQQALEKYQEAAKISHATHVELLYRLGRCHLMLKSFSDAQRLLRRALRLDPDNSRLRRDYEKAKRRV